MEPTEAPEIFLASFRMPLSSSALSAPGSAAPFAPPPEKVISRTGGGGEVNRTPPFGLLVTTSFLPVSVVLSCWLPPSRARITVPPRWRPEPSFTPEPVGGGMIVGVGTNRTCFSPRPGVERA